LSALVLDTHILVWLVDGDRTLPPSVVAAIELSALQNAVFVSAITPWEIAMLVAKGRLTLTRDVRQWIDEALSQPGIKLAPLEPAIAVASSRLPGDLHDDPADRIIVATARHLGARLVTVDERLLAYGAAGHVALLHDA